MGQNSNNFMIYVRKSNIDKWNILQDSKHMSDFVNWALKEKYDEYKGKVDNS